MEPGRLRVVFFLDRHVYAVAAAAKCLEILAPAMASRCSGVIGRPGQVKRDTPLATGQKRNQIRSCAREGNLTARGKLGSDEGWNGFDRS
jgi:hypothetical protein